MLKRNWLAALWFNDRLAGWSLAEFVGTISAAFCLGYAAMSLAVWFGVNYFVDQLLGR